MNNENDPYKTFEQDDEPARSLEPGTVLAGRYHLIKQIGRGGMGVVWSAEDKTAGRKIVLKFVPHDLKNFESAVAQLKESFLKIHSLQHQHICPVYTLEEDSSLGYYLVMKWLDGETLDQYVARKVGRQQPLPFDKVVQILQPVAEALDYAHKHEKKIIHRDIKPSNIFLVLDKSQEIEDVQVIDFGLASEIRSSLTRVSQVRFDMSGTRPYMAPEQWRSRPQTGQTDQYALAVMAYELLAGHLPFEGDDLEMLRLSVLQDPPEPIEGVPEHVNAALLKALAKDGKDRFGSCREFLAALDMKMVSPPMVPVTSFTPPQPVPSAVQEVSKAGERMVLKIKEVEYLFRWCPPGKFMMGSPPSEPERGKNETLHEVTLTQGFWLLETQVTQAMWESVLGSNPSCFKGKRLPVEQVSWNDCQEYITWLNKMNPKVTPTGYKFSLPTEAQWEYACRAGADTPFPYHFGSVLNGDKANCNGNYFPYGTMAKGKYLGYTSVVGSYPANAWGLHDMHGNVYEWCLDLYSSYPNGSVTDPIGKSFFFPRRVLRGGSWSNFARDCRSACRAMSHPSYRRNSSGLRLALVRENTESKKN